MKLCGCPDNEKCDCVITPGGRHDDKTQTDQYRAEDTIDSVMRELGEGGFGVRINHDVMFGEAWCDEYLVSVWKIGNALNTTRNKKTKKLLATLQEARDRLTPPPPE